MQDKNKLRVEVEQIVEWNVNSAINEAHITFGTESGDITPEQDELLTRIKFQLTELLTEQVHQNL